MNRIDFVKEVKNSNKCPHNFDHLYKEFNKFQNEALNTLKEFHKICEKNNITYTLAYGSMLGAVRDRGQIPWDYDIDVFVPIEEKDTLIEALTKSLNDSYYFICAEVDHNCRHFMIRVSPISYSTEVIHVDVFFLCGCPDNEEERIKFANQIEKYSKIRYYQYINIIKEIVKNPKATMKNVIGKIKSLFYNKQFVFDRIKNMIEKYNAKDSKYNIHADIFASDYVYLSNEMWNTIDIEFDDGTTFKVSKEYDKILTSMYGDYMKIPELEKRIKEFLTHYKIIVNSIKNKETNE